MDNNDDSGSGSTTNRQACAACKHQRKKCSQNCILSPFFPSDKNQQFQAVHKLFGVSNVSKLLRSLGNFDERKKAIDSLIWEAQCRESDPILGCYGHYSRVFNELQLLKNQQQQQQVVAVPTNAMNKPIGPLLMEYYGNNNGITSAGADTVVHYNNNGYLQSNAGLILEPIQHGYGSINVQEQEKIFQRRDNNGHICIPNSFNLYYDPGN